MVGEHVIVYYRDPRGVDRKMHGVLTETSGNNLYLENEGWRGVLSVAHNQVSLVSTVAGWNKADAEDSGEDEQKGGGMRSFFKWMLGV